MDQVSSGLGPWAQMLSQGRRRASGLVSGRDSARAVFQPSDRAPQPPLLYEIKSCGEGFPPPDVTGDSLSQERQACIPHEG